MSNINNDAYTSDLVNKYSLDFPIIDLEGVKAKTFERDIAAFPDSTTSTFLAFSL